MGKITFPADAPIFDHRDALPADDQRRPRTPSANASGLYRRRHAPSSSTSCASSDLDRAERMQGQPGSAGRRQRVGTEPSRLTSVSLHQYCPRCPPIWRRL